MVTSLAIKLDRQELTEQRKARLAEIDNQIKALDVTKYELLSKVLDFELWRGTFHSSECYLVRHHVSSAELREMAKNGKVE